MVERPYPKLADNAKYVGIISLTYGLLLFSFLGLLKYYTLTPYLAPELPLPRDISFYNALTASILLAILPPGLLVYLKNKAIDDVEKSIPIFLRDAAELIRSGWSFPRAIVELSGKPYGKLSTLLKRIALRISLGEDFEQAVALSLKAFPLAIKKYFLMLVEAHNAGGRVGEVLDDAALFASTIRGFEEEKRRSLRVYAMILYISLIIFLLSAGSILYMSVSLQKLSGKGGPLIRGFVTTEDLMAVFYLVGVFESIFAGLVVGKIVGRSMSVGIVHVVVLMVMVSIFFNSLHVYLSTL